MLAERIGRRVALMMCVALASLGAAWAQSAGPQPGPLPTPIAAAQDIPFPGVIRLAVDATDVERRIFRVHELIPVTGGEEITLLFPQWLPANHAAYGRIENLSGLVIRANGKRLNWRRDPVNVFAFHVNVPADATTLDARFEFASSVDKAHGRIVMTQEMLNLQWRSVVLYPAGHFVRQIEFEPSVTVPEGWQLATALEVAEKGDNTTVFKSVSLETLVDSPIFAGRYFNRVDLNPDGDVDVHLNVVADRPDLLEISPDALQAHRDLVVQADKLFKSHHYDHYDFLYALTDRMGGIGLEHHQSSENSAVPEFFTDWETNPKGRDLLAHEYTHSWNGKFRIPADLWTPDFTRPMQGSLLWLYEGQTQYWGHVLAARAGFMSKQQALDSLASTAATYEYRKGRDWRTLQDTTNDPVATMRRSLPWRSWSRSEDYYSEGRLIWLDADTLIREKSGGKKSLDDFASAFFGINDGSRVPVSYEFNDIVTALNAVQPHDWQGFLRSRLDSHGPGAPLDGIARGGYKLVYKDTPSDHSAAFESANEVADLSYSIGIKIGAEAMVSDVLWDSPAFENGLKIGNQLIAVNGIAYDIDGLKRAITAAKDGGAGIDILVKDGVHYRTVSFDYRKGLRYPHLERASGEALIDQIIAPRD